MAPPTYQYQLLGTLFYRLISSNSLSIDYSAWLGVTDSHLIARQLKLVFAVITEEEKLTFHDIGALDEKTVQRHQGKDPKKLGGWASEKMVKNYDSGHSEIRWINAGADLKIAGI
ncbi:hypothetical protein O5O45_04785 [Hahella aquimaris]|uniref:hypothetical protein n=1 Tax=Hahella sp. HNIBRBA332 TaxID=3015983 RepID=UPI00273B6ABC|nr:hypothetical protein [Hahella sp. HNIBRBA332]WLQ15240.1 hypothetical protein O5O45_04785 [Hahella sp. HNIBRBA332]